MVGGDFSEKFLENFLLVKMEKLFLTLHKFLEFFGGEGDFGLGILINLDNQVIGIRPLLLSIDQILEDLLLLKTRDPLSPLIIEGVTLDQEVGPEYLLIFLLVHLLVIHQRQGPILHVLWEVELVFFLDHLQL